MTKAPFTGQSERASELLALVYTDVCGPMSSTARGSFGYFIIFTDDFSRYGYVYLTRHKSESFKKFKEFQNEETKGYCFYKREEGKVFVAQHGVFLEKEFISKKDSESMVGLEEIQESPVNASTSTQPQQVEQDVVQLVEQVVVEPAVEAPASRRSDRI
uniref:OSJNBa0067G20.16 protein n=1 Tax=Oryza sativa subsp. japonica TaxID=39947 RepID=Q7XVS3_ORYSJ|nr:OSJNBa0067G20.16 [Oryza sativa Japonica Group]